MPQVSVAIDVSTRAARLMVWESTFRSAELIALKTVELDPDSPLEERWSRIHAELPPNVDCVVATVNAGRVSTRLLSFPFSDLRKVEAALEFELEGQVPYAADEMAATWHVADRIQGSVRMLAAVAPKDSVRIQVASMAAAGFEPRSVLFPAAVLQELLPPEADSVPVAVVSLGAAQSHLGVFRRGLQYARTLRAGGDDVDRAIAREYGASIADARLAKHSEVRIASDPTLVPADARRASEAAAKGLNSLISTLSATFKSLPEEEVPQRMFITGGLSRLPGLPELLQERLGMEVQLLDLQEGLGEVQSSLSAVAPEYAVVLATGLAHMRRGRTAALNFRRGALAYEGDIQLYRGQITHAAVGLAIVILLAITGSLVRYGVVSAEEEQIKEGFCVATEKIVGRRICDPTAALATMRQAPGASEGMAIPSYSAATLYEMMSKALNPDVAVTFDELDFKLESHTGASDRITGKGEASSFETTELVVASLKRDPCVQEVEVSKQRKKRNSTQVEFQLTVKVRCEEAGVVPGSKLQVAATAPSAPAVPGSGQPARSPAAVGAPGRTGAQ